MRSGALIGGAFVVLWSTGFVGARLVAPYADPLWILAIRFAIVTAITAAIALALRRPWPGRRLALDVAIVGALLHGVYLGGVFWSIAEGMPAGVSALIAGLQPVVTACLVGPLLGERVAPRQWAGFAAGLGGIGLVLFERVAIEGVTARATALSFVALAGVTGGVLHQKRRATGADLWTGAAIQYAAACAVVGLGAVALEERVITWNAQVLAGLAWMVLVLSIGAISLLMLVIRRSTAAQTVSLMYLAPPLAPIEGWLIFDETLGALAVAGMAIAATGVWLVQRGAGT